MLITLQEACIARMLEPRTSENRAQRNRSRAALRYRREVAKLGYTQEQIDTQVRDIFDMWRLYRDAE
jgi:hypothetical protein